MADQSLTLMSTLQDWMCALCVRVRVRATHVHSTPAVPPCPVISQGADVVMSHRGRSQARALVGGFERGGGLQRWEGLYPHLHDGVGRTAES